MVEIDLKYEGYIQRQAGQNQKLIRTRGKSIPSDIDYERIAGLRRASRQKLVAARPTSIGQAEQLRGVTPADISILSIWLEKNRLDVSREMSAG
jgi:tRNA uridine 5-carboxymethylaminomethyl modification enzyme